MGSEMCIRDRCQEQHFGYGMRLHRAMIPLAARIRAALSTPTDALSDGLREAAEVAAWNDAIEAAAVACDKRGLKYAVPSIAATVADDCAEDIRALRRAAPTEGEA